MRNPPTQAELERLYFELAKVGGTSVGQKRSWRYRPDSFESLLALSGEMLRFDPRLLSILVQLFLARWRDVNPLHLRTELRAMRWPQALLVALEFAREATDDAEFRHFADYLAAGFARVEPAERFFLDMEKPGSRMAERRLGRNLAGYARWGFIGSERPVVDPVTKRALGRYDARTRRAILHDLIERHGELTLADYLAAVDHAISRQQALADLRRSPGLQPRGHGRGARWTRRAGPAKPA
ncbi:MAG TPA: hypothetical protein VJV78_34640 [Polyangiales bacterium]|nr:hypothetical protein [Polyangiales bacterium]